jgi:phosphate/sulfate permease
MQLTFEQQIIVALIGGIVAAVLTSIINNFFENRRLGIQLEAEDRRLEKQWQREKEERQEQWNKEKEERQRERKQQLLERRLSAANDYMDQFSSVILMIRTGASREQVLAFRDEITKRLLPLSVDAAMLSPELPKILQQVTHQFGEIVSEMERNKWQRTTRSDRLFNEFMTTVASTKAQLQKIEEKGIESES